MRYRAALHMLAPLALALAFGCAPESSLALDAAPLGVVDGGVEGDRDVDASAPNEWMYDDSGRDPARPTDFGLGDGTPVALIPDAGPRREADVAPDADPGGDSDPPGDADSEVGPDAAPPPPIPLDGLVLEALFEEEGPLVLDTSAAWGDGRLGRQPGVDAADPIRADGPVGRALSFDGEDDQVEFPDRPPGANVSVVAWIFVTADADIDRIIVGKHNDELDLRINEAGHLAGGVGGEFVQDSDYRFKPPGGGFARWVHVGYTYDAASGQHRLFRDGAAVAERVAPARIRDTDRPLRIGRHSQFDFGTFAGSIDQVRIYARALTDDEIRAIHTRESQPPPAPVCNAGEGLRIYRRRVEPLVTGGQPATCNQCHLAGVELSAFVQGDPCGSMACLVSQGLVDLDRPAESAILEQILLARPDNALITPEVIRAEHDGVLEWIRFSAACGEAVCPPVDDPCPIDGAPRPVEPPPGPLGACAEEALGAAFERQVMVTIDRCAGCHAVDGPRFQAEAPLFIAPGPGRDAALATMYTLVGLGAVDVAEPRESLLLTKPLAPEAGGVEHGGGPKFRDFDDPSARSYVQWLDAYAGCAADGELALTAGAPMVGILAPAPGAEVGDRPTLRGEAIDPEDGLLGGDALVWRTDRAAEPLGAGPVVEGLRLAPGEHTISLSATDQDGNQTDASVRVVVR